jgi:transcriptional regulator with XRE-family HTH domain
MKNQCPPPHYPAGMNSQEELVQLHRRLRTIRESKALTLNQVAARSDGRISAIALGSYERGDRSISAQKVLELAEIYQLPAAELFSQPEQLLEQGRVVIDFRKLTNDSDPSSLRMREIVTAIASVRRDWNGEVISLRESDVRSLQIFASLSGAEINALLNRFAFTKSK